MDWIWQRRWCMGWVGINLICCCSRLWIWETGFQWEKSRSNSCYYAHRKSSFECSVQECAAAESLVRGCGTSSWRSFWAEASPQKTNRPFVFHSILHMLFLALGDALEVLPAFFIPHLKAMPSYFSRSTQRKDRVAECHNELKGPAMYMHALFV